MSGLHLITPADPARVLTLPHGGAVPPPVGRKLPNTTILVQDRDRPEVIWKLTPWEKAESVMAELDIHARLLARGGVTGIVRLLGVSGTTDHLARAYEYAPFGELHQFLRGPRGERPVPDPQVARAILARIAAVMAGLHAQDIVHRDLKAENVLVFTDDPVPLVKLADFDRAVELPVGATLTEPVGSLFHMAPELLARKPYDRRVDLYAFGILIFEVAHGGARLWPQVATGLPGSLTAPQFVAKVVEEGLRPEWRADDDSLRALASDCLAADPAARPGFDEICQRLAVAPAYRPVVNPTPRARDIGMAATIGNRRRTMEDALCVLDTGDSVVLAVFDGLRGHRSSMFAVHALNLILSGMLRGHDDPEAALRQAFARLQSCLRRLDPAIASGSTATVAVLKKGGAHVAWVGDSPAWLVDGPGMRLLTSPHHPSDDDERQRIEAAGGSVRREMRIMDSGEAVPWGPLRVFAADGQGGIALSRALGLPSLEPVLSCQPEIRHVRALEGGRFLVLCSDGVEVLAPERIETICDGADDAQQAAEQIIAEVLQHGAPDNASVIVAAL